MRTIAIVSKPQKPELVSILTELVEWLRTHDFEPILDPVSGSYTDVARVVAREAMGEVHPDLVVVLGGDGTLLAAARVFAKLGTPILSVNLGSLGFLTEVRLSELYDTLGAWCLDCGALEYRTMLHSELWRDGHRLCHHEALNDIVVSKGTIARMGEFSLEVDGKLAASYRADGVIVAKRGCPYYYAGLPAPAHYAAACGARRRSAEDHRGELRRCELPHCRWTGGNLDRQRG